MPDGLLHRTTATNSMEGEDTRKILCKWLDEPYVYHCQSHAISSCCHHISTRSTAASQVLHWSAAIGPIHRGSARNDNMKTDRMDSHVMSWIRCDHMIWRIHQGAGDTRALFLSSSYPSPWEYKGTTSTRLWTRTQSGCSSPVPLYTPSLTTSYLWLINSRQ